MPLKTDSPDPGEAGGVESTEMRQPEIRTCPTCGSKFSAASDIEFCPVCILRGAAGDEESSAAAAPIPAGGSEHSSEEGEPTSPVQRFENYELMLDAEGRPVELGRGAMGITYKALDVDLRFPVTLKVIGEKYIGDESARRRFLREARVAASVRHPNVASVFRLGRVGKDYFYAMEYVEGETLGNLIKHSGPLELKLALGIATQVAAGLGAVHEQSLVHRDIKPTNIMVSLKDEDRAIAKIIDLGLAKTVSQPGLESAISTPGSFAGTPEFASPEQFAGVGVDIRSDLYSLGVTLWMMLTGNAPFGGTPAELIYQHHHAPLPLEQLKSVPRQVTALLETLLNKDPKRRFQTPIELLKTMSMVTRELETPANQKHEFPTPLVRKAGSRQPRLPRTRVQERSIAVLPFESLSGNKRDTYFADGVQDEILSNLAKASQLKVISRTSVMTFRPGDDRNLRSIAEALGVAHVVEGTVRRHGKRVRITIRLVDARTDEALWSEIYDRDLTDIFGIQSKIAKKVAAKLSVHLSPEERKDIEEEPTADLEAYDLYLRAKQLFANPPAIRIVDEHDDLLKAVELLQEATHRDSKFVLAHCLLARAHDELYRLDRDHEWRALGDAAVNEALRLRPNLPEAHIATAFHLYKCYRNYRRARVQIAIAERARANCADALACTAYIDRREGRLEESTNYLEKALSLDPRNPEYIKQLATNYLCLRRNRDFERTYDQVIKFQPEEKPLLMLERAFFTLRSKADLPSCRAALEGVPTSLKHDRRIASHRFSYAVFAREWAMAKEISCDDSNAELYFSNAEALVPSCCLQIWLARVQGGYPRMRADFAAARDQLHQKVEAHPEDLALLSVLGLVDAALGRAQEAMNEARRAAEMLPISEDAWDGPSLVYNLAAVCALTNEPSLTFEHLSKLVETPGGISYGELKLDPAWDPLRKDQRFDKLLAQLVPRE